MKFETVAERGTVGRTMGALLVALALTADIQADLIRTKDGKLHAGKVISETSAGYLFRDDSTGQTAVIEFSAIDDMKRASDEPKIERQTVVVSDKAASLARAFQLRTEIADLHTELEDSTVGAPISKLLVGTAFGVLAVFMFSAFSQVVDCNNRNLYGCGSGSTFLGAGVPSATFSLTLFIWGGIQLRNRVEALNRLPLEIANREEQLRALEAAR